MPGVDSVQVLKDCRTLAVVGLSANPGRVSHSVCAYMVEHGYRVIGVNPNYPEVFGERIDCCSQATGARLGPHRAQPK